jgi:replication initiation and membrane attachment protein DnaB
MPVDGATRHKLHTSARATLGQEEGDALMELLPPIGWDDFATKHDLNELETRLGYRFEAIDHRFDAAEARVDTRFETLERRFDKIDARFEKVDDRFKQMDERFATIESHLTERFESFEHKFMAALHKAMLRQTLALVALVVTLTLGLR